MKGPIVKRYIYAGLGALGLAGAGVAVAMTLTPPNDIATAIVEPTYTVSASPSASPTGSTGTPDASASPEATTTPSEPAKPAEAVTVDTLVPPADPQSTDPIGSNDPFVNVKQDPGNEPALAPSQEMKTRADGTIYFVDANTGQEIKAPEAVAPAAGNNSEAPKPVDAIGAGSQEDKTNAATSYMNHLNALYNKNWNEACNYVLLPEGLTAADCANRLEKRTNERPFTSKYSLNNVNTVNVQGNNAKVSSLALKDANGEGTRAVTLTRSSGNAGIWLVDGKSLLDIT